MTWHIKNAPYLFEGKKKAGGKESRGAGVEGEKPRGRKREKEKKRKE